MALRTRKAGLTTATIAPISLSRAPYSERPCWDRRASLTTRLRGMINERAVVVFHQEQTTLRVEAPLSQAS